MPYAIKVRKLIKSLSNIKDAFRVLEIIDHMGGVDIEKVTRDGLDKGDYWKVKPKGYLSEKDARISVDINATVEVRENESSKQLSEESRQRPRRRNRFLRDLIRILLIRELLRRRRPGFPIRPF